jgi:ribosomal protein S2
MKLKRITNLKYKLIKLELVKSKISQNIVLNSRLENMEVYLKKALLIIFQYHLNNKKILFVGINKKIQNSHKKSLKKTKHLFLPDSYWIKGLLTNKVTVFKYIKKRVNLFTSNKVKNYFFLKNKPNLIVLFDAKIQASIIKEAVKLKIPVIALNSEIQHDNGISYQLPVNCSGTNTKKNSFFLSLLNSMFKKIK